MAADFDILNPDVASIQDMLAASEIRSVQLVEAYLAQISKHNKKGMGLKALISLAPTESVLVRARQLDEEREKTGPRGPFHGIPIVLRDTILTDASLGINTTCGTTALLGARSNHNANIVELVLKAGMVILGKANLDITK